VEESRQSRIAKLAPEIARKRRKLSIMKIAHDKVPPYMRERHGNQIQQISEELQKLEAEFHNLNVEQIREELRDSQSDS
jgi:hypothetical protein